VHIIGDLHQPLHDEALEVGGNDIDVTFADEETNLHHIWDTNMPEKLIGGYALSDAQDWATELTTSIQSGSYKSQVPSWKTGINVSDPITTSLEWSRQANAYVCSTVLPDRQAAVEDVDLSGAYYNTAVPIVEVQIARAGVRLAAYLDAVASDQNVAEKRDVAREADLTGADLLPAPRPLSKVKLVRQAVGYGCKH